MRKKAFVSISCNQIMFAQDLSLSYRITGLGKRRDKIDPPEADHKS